MFEKTPLILIIEDELAIRRFLKTAILSQNYRYVEAKNGQEAFIMIAEQKPDIILLDLGLPDIDGLEIIKHLRSFTAIPIIVLSARDQEKDKAAALDQGADDYLTKPFSIVELNARMRVALRHAKHIHETETPIFRSGKWHVNLIQREVFLEQNKITLSPIQYAIFATLIRKANKIVTHKELLREVWGEHHTEDVEYLRIYLYQLRHKIEKNPAQPIYLKTEPGVGYRFTTEEC